MGFYQADEDEACVVDMKHNTRRRCSDCHQPVCDAHVDRHICSAKVDRGINFAEAIWIIIVVIVVLILTSPFWW